MLFSTQQPQRAQVLSNMEEEHKRGKSDESELQIQRSDAESGSGDPTPLPEISDCCVSGGGGAGGGAGGSARYKLMSPAKLPISRSSCITIPPGLSPTSFLESPVLLSNVKAEPSPTTGSFSKPQLVHGSDGLALHSVSTVGSNTFTERKSGFEFWPHGNMVHVGLTHLKSELSVPVQRHCSYPLASSPPMKSELAMSSNELSLSSSPVHMVTSVLSTAAEVDSDEPNLIGNVNSGFQSSQTDHKGGMGASASSDDGYNWRKYGQKHVKGSEFPRSYYKCTHPNCEVKKLFERSHDGQITEIIYKGTHDHPKPLPGRRYSAGSALSMLDERADKASSVTGQDVREDKSPSIYGQISQNVEPNATPEFSPVAANDDSPEGAEVDDDDSFSKRRKMDIGGVDVTPVVKPIREPRVVVQTLSEVDILDDGYRWRKYGQKVVRGNPNPRSYYKCTNAGCPVRKHVERASHDPKAVITTYEGKHNHDIPTARNSSHDNSAPSTMNGPSRIILQESSVVSLDLGVGISSAVEHQSGEQQQLLHHHGMQRQTQSSSLKMDQATPVAPYNLLNDSVIQYGSRENPSEGRSPGIPRLNHSYPYPQQNMGRLLTGP